jgi:hypothetical protein
MRSPAGQVSGPAVNPGLDTAGITAGYFGAGEGQEMAYFDDFLTPQALHELRRPRESALNSSNVVVISY